MTSTARTEVLSTAGVSIWLDDLSRRRLTDGSLRTLIDTRNVVGVTTNPAIFEAAIGGSADYQEDVTALAADGADTAAIVDRLTCDDVRSACDLFAPVHAATDGVDGRVSLEVDPRLARDTQGTIDQARALHAAVGRDNVMIKIPATREGLPAITAVLGEGISVNVTLIFSVDRYREVIDAWLAGLELARERGHDLSTIASVASFFVSRVDTEIDARLEALGTEEALAARGRAGVANARAAFGAYLDMVGSDRFTALAEAGARPQRPLWASTGVKNPAYPDTLYVDQLVADPCVNTMPEKTLDAVADHSDPAPAVDRAAAEEGARVLESIAGLGVDLDDVFARLETEGVDKFVAAWEKLLETVRSAARS